MTPAERMRERAAELAASRPIRLMTEAECVEARADLAAAIRALPLPEEAPPTAQEKLRRVREAREFLATARVAYVETRLDTVIVDASDETRLAATKWRASASGLRTWVALADRVVHSDVVEHGEDFHAWALAALRAEGWDVVEEGTVQDG